MDITHIDPHTAQQITDLGVRLGETTARNTVSFVNDKIKAIKTKRDQREVIQELEEIVYDLLDDKNDLRQIAEAYKEKFVVQQISKEDIEYITESVIPVLKTLLVEYSNNQNGTTAMNAASLQKTLDTLESLLSVKMLTVLQLVGFNFKQAIGEPLTLLLRQLITSKAPIDTQSNAEYAQLTMAFNLEVAKIAQDEDATERWERLKH